MIFVYLKVNKDIDVRNSAMLINRKKHKCILIQVLINNSVNGYVTNIFKQIRKIVRERNVFRVLCNNKIILKPFTK